MELFGFQINRKKEENEEEKLQSLVPKTYDDGAVEIAAGGAYGTYVDLEGKAKNEGELVTKYREMAMQPECDEAIKDIVNEAIIIDDESAQCVEIQLDNLEQPESIKKKIRNEFHNVMKILDFNNYGYDIFRKWYIDGRLYYQIVIDTENPRAGIRDLRAIDPRRIRKIRQPIKEKDPRTGATVYKGVNEYYLYSQKGIGKASTTQGVKISKDSICYVHSGIMNAQQSMVLSHLHKAIKPMNQLRMLEDAVVIYRLSRAPERRIFYIDVGNLPKMKAEQYLRDMMAKHKNKIAYDAATGEVRDDRRFMTMMEDFWLPRREGGRGTEITTLPGGQNLGEMEDVDYFRRKLYKSLNVPVTRMESESSFNLGRANEVTRDEVKFSKFIGRLRNRFSILFDELLEIQLALKGVVSRKEWESLKQDIYYDFTEDNHYAELKEAEILRERLQLLGELDPYVGKYYSGDWVRKNILRMSEEDIKDIQKQIDDEEKSGEFEGDEEEQDQPPQREHVEEVPEFIPPKEISNEEKKLVESMTKFMDSMIPEKE